MTATAPMFLDVGGTSIAVRQSQGAAVRPSQGAAPGVVWLGGYKSDMLGTKAETLAGWAAKEPRAFLRHDYSGHGESGGAFADGTISKWLAESLAVFRRFTQGKQILVGSSMGAWIALRMVQELRKAGDASVTGLVLLAPAPDFTAELVEPALTEAQKQDLLEKGFFAEPSDYSAEPYIYTRALIDDGRKNLVMGGPIDTHCPVHILQGLADADVPSSHALKLAALLPADDVTLSLIPDGDHRLSRPQDLDLLLRAVGDMVQRGM
ncbi:MAG: alpha/beta hydrolase [Mesorhizobium sp.]|uniref:alpha/beta hydrolase n=1 Tax=Mesorhizobium sp. TaxID=1871066 RepID=UPI000FE51BA7|nr:alpha/beta hydrolase [Mesorhizobium sp.]RWF26579.1 MAG: alpha/beta hydrolase [Mesorhizobium sp.]RWF39787.1 MAG: alpha/beta hydrolase [Mesorhizobium sp.]TIX14945.1 MAG: alpha/beta hydrolase [Mesorhizobium sp.]TJW07663.1 MAG: alpha/beta hydrolase [Mesorhizobium sp.]